MSLTPMREEARKTTHGQNTLQLRHWQVPPVRSWNTSEVSFLLSLLHRPEAANEFYDGDHDNDKESDVEIWPALKDWGDL